MFKLKSKTKMFLILLLIVALLPIFSFASNEEMVIVEKEDGRYVIYLKDYLSDEFEFAFSNNKEDTELSYIDSAKDSEDAENEIAYVDDSITGIDFTKTVYMWVRQNGEVKIEAREINIENNVKEEKVNNIEKVSNTIKISLEEKETKNETDAEGLHTTITVGVAKVESENEVEFCLVPRDESENSKNIYSLAELINKNQFTDAYTKIKAIKEFTDIYESEITRIENENKWEKVENNEVLQPEEAQDGDKYILFLKENDKITDAHFLTSLRKESEEIIQEEVVTKLPVLGDNNTLFIILIAQVILIAIVCVRIKSLKNKTER